MLTSLTCRLPASAWRLRIPAPLRSDDGGMAESPEIQSPRLFHRTATAPRSTAETHWKKRMKNRLGWTRRTGTLLRWDQGFKSGLLQRGVGRTAGLRDPEDPY